MTLTLEEVTEQRERLRQEIMERQCLLAAFEVMHGYLSKGNQPKALALSPLVSALSPSPRAVALPGPTIEAEEPAAPVALPPPAPVPRYIHPELKGCGISDVFLVRWAIARMTGDFSLTDLQSLLRQEGYDMQGARISVVLTRMRRKRELEVIERSHGPIPARFRKPAGTPAEEMKPADLINHPDASTAFATIP